VRALIVGSEGARGSIAAARALTKSGWIVGIGSPDHGPATGSRSVHRVHDVPAPHDLKAFVKAVNAAIVAGGYEVIFPAGDAELLALSAMRKSVRGIVPYPAHERVQAALDKVRLMSIAETAGVRVPPRIEPGEDALRAATYPLIIKAGMHWSPENSAGRRRLEAERGADATTAFRPVAELQAHGAEVVIQEVTTGDLLAYTALVGEEGKVIADVQQRADRVWPPGSGVSVRAVTEPVDEDLRAGVARLLSELGWLGLAQLQFIAADDGHAYLIDLNGRFYGSLALAIGAGCDLPSAWANLATGRPVELQEARAGVRYQWLEGDLRRAAQEQRGGRSADVRSCLAYARGAVHSVWNPTDPAPALSYVGTLTGRAARKIFR
jgi:predicted ATP-grasp superfamily ATP-dependent carboligase